MPTKHLSNLVEAHTPHLSPRNRVGLLDCNRHGERQPGRQQQRRHADRWRQVIRQVHPAQGQAFHDDLPHQREA